MAKQFEPLGVDCGLSSPTPETMQKWFVPTTVNPGTMKA
jgi:hypothetical protein